MYVVCTYVVYYKTTRACTQKCSPTHVDICDYHDKRIHSTHQTHMQLLKYVCNIISNSFFFFPLM